MMHGTEADNMAAELVRSTLQAIRAHDPQMAELIAQKMGRSTMNGISGILDDFSGAISSIGSTALDFYKDKLQAQTAADQAKSIATAEATKAQLQLQQQQLQAQSVYAQQQLQAQQLQLQQYKAQLSSGSLNTALMVAGAGLVVLLIVSRASRHR